MTSTKTLSSRNLAFLFLTIGAFLALLGFAGNAGAVTRSGGTGTDPWISSELPDYAPGSTVNLLGGSWQPGEAVHINVNDSDGQTWVFNDDVTADPNGDISDSFSLPNWFVANYSVTATGASGSVATASFTDGNATSVSGTVTDSITSAVISGATVTCTSGCSNSPAASTSTNGAGVYTFDNTTTKLSFGGNGPTTLVLTVSKTGYSNGTITLTNVNNGDTLTGKNVALVPAGPTKLAFTTAPATGTVGQCLGPIVVQTQNASSTPTNVTASTTVNLATDNGATGAGAFYSDSGCSAAVTTRTIATGNNSASFFYSATARGSGAHQLTASATGLTSASQTETINKANQATLSITAPTSATFGDADTAFTTSGGSGAGALSFSAGTSTACSIVSGKLHVITGTGSCSITASKASDNDYNGTTSAPFAVTINKANQAALSITAPTSATFGDADATITTSGGSGGGALSFSAGTSTACSIVSGKLHVITGTGTCSITATKASDNDYKGTTSAAFTVTVDKANANCSSISGYHVTYDGSPHTASGTCKGVDGTTVLAGLDKSGTTHTNAGDYLSDPWTFTDSSGNYNDTSGTVHDQIDKANANCSSISGYHVTYDGSPHTASGTCKGVDGTTVLAGLDKSGTTHTNAGDYLSDPWTFTDSSGNYNDTSGTVHDQIDKANANCSSISGYHVTYDGSPHTASGTCKGVDGTTVLAGLDKSGTTHTNAGDYLSDPWTFTDSSGNYNDTSGTVHDQIDKANANCSSISGYHVTYDGSPHTASGTCKGVDGTTVLAGLDKSGTTHTNAGDYLSDPWTFTDSSGNYNDTSGTVHDQIDKANANCSSISGYHVTYDGSPHTASGTCKGVDGTTVLAGLDKSGTTHTNAGDYLSDPWTFTDSSGNYNDTSGTVHDQIDKANANCSSISGYHVTYDGSPHTASGTCKGVDGTTVLAGLDKSGTTHTNAGDYLSDPWTFTDSSGNYNDTSGTVHDQIDKANANCSSISGYHVTYDGSPHTASGTCKGVDGTTVLAGLDKSGTTHTNAGDYLSDPWTFTDSSGNYNDTSGTVHDQIDKANANCSSISGYHVTYDGSPHTASGTCKGVDGTTVLAGLDKSGTTHTNAGDYLSDPWTFTDSSGNYNDTSGTVHDQIDKANANCSSISGYHVTYDGSPHTASGTCKGVDGTTVLAGLDKSGTTHTNAGDYLSDPWTFTDSSGNYNDTSGTVHDQIDKANANCSSISGYHVTYDGSPHTASGTCKGVDGTTVLAGLDKSGTTHTNAGDYLSDPWTFTDSSGNYNDTSGTVHDQIDKVQLAVTADNKSKTYDGNPFTGFTRTITGFVNSETESVVSGNVVFGGPAITATNAGNYVISIDVSGLSATNYSFAGNNGNLAINQRLITVTADPKSKVFSTGDPPLTYQLTSGTFVTGDGFTGSLTRDPGEAVGSYPIRKGTLSAGGNYALTYVGANLTISAWNAAGKGFYAPVGIANSIFTAAPASAPASFSSATMTWNVVKGGQTVPMKFNVFAGAVEKTGSDAFTDPATAFHYAKMSTCTNLSDSDPVDYTTTATGSTVLRYDTTGLQWIYNWATPKVSQTTCYRTWVAFADGSTLEAFFQLNK